MSIIEGLKDTPIAPPDRKRGATKRTDNVDTASTEVVRQEPRLNGSRSSPQAATMDSAEAIAQHAVAITNRATTEVVERLRKLRSMIDMLEAELIQDAGRVNAAIQNSMRMAASAGQAADAIERQIEEFRASVAHGID